MYKKYVWYKVQYKFVAKYNGKTYETFIFSMTNDNDPNAIEKLIQKYGNNFVKVEEWII